jgi:RecB family endonuclease NucS
MSMPLIKTGAYRWAFNSEAALEDWFWSNLESLLQLKPLRRQYFVRGQYCDILAVGPEKALYILELKNAEDRYIVQQLTRYYDALIAEKPFQEEIDYQKPPQLIAIAPSIHQNTKTDLKYHTLNIKAFSFSLQANPSTLNFLLLDENSQVIANKEIPYSESATNKRDIPDSPRFLLNLFSKLPSEHREVYLQIRDRILSFDGQIQEIKHGNGVRYGRGSNKPCAQLQMTADKYMRCYLWLPSLNSSRRHKQIVRMEIGGHLRIPDQDFFLTHCPDGTRRSGTTWRLNAAMKMIKIMGDVSTLEVYDKLIKNENPQNNFDILLEIALNAWLNRHG